MPCKHTGDLNTLPGTLVGLIAIVSAVIAAKKKQRLNKNPPDVVRRNSEGLERFEGAAWASRTNLLV